MHLYTTDEFDKFMKKARLTDAVILKIANEIHNGLHDGELDRGHLFKKRIASPGQGKRDSNRAIVAVVQGQRLFFLDGWRKADIPKSGKEIPDKLLEVYKLLGKSFRNLTPAQIEENLQTGLIREIPDD